MELESIYQLENSSNEKSSRQLLATHLRELVAYRNKHPDESQRIAYEIAGLLSTSFGRQLKDGDPLLEILVLAGELELPDEHRTTATWKKFEEQIHTLSG